MAAVPTAQSLFTGAIQLSHPALCTKAQVLLLWDVQQVNVMVKEWVLLKLMQSNTAAKASIIKHKHLSVLHITIQQYCILHSKLNIKLNHRHLKQFEQKTL